jgi:hypothetical protein
VKAEKFKSIIPVMTLGLFILGGLQLPTITFAAPDQNEKIGTPIVTTLLPITDDDLFSTADLTTLIDPTVTATQHYGPYGSSSPDSGTCGNDWATDTFDRHFTVFKEPDGTFLVVEQFKDGNFVTPSVDSPHPNPSPGGCQNSPIPQGTVNDGVTGRLHGYFTIPLPAGTMQTSNSPFCDAFFMTNSGCNTTRFIDTHFTPCYGTGLCSVTTFFFHYAAGNQGLIQNEWKNASADRGGNNGDIRSSNV